MVEAPGYVAGLSDLMTTEIRPKTPTRHRENAPSSAGHRVIIEAHGERAPRVSSIHAREVVGAGSPKAPGRTSEVTSPGDESDRRTS
jgi:hypothetical protein